ncbi:MAG TPA: ABC transporter ATP-binding protein [Vicinamibacteria bacterium]|nr:ABC transporter ATP-binding protein [Vicinamibacteria bacterium]
MLRLSNLEKRFGEVTAVDGLSLSVRQGEIFGLLGPNGAGKTTTVHMAMGLLAPDAGSVEIEGHGAPTTAAVRTKLGLAPQALAVYDGLTGEENVRFFASLYGLRGGRLRERVAWALDFVGLADRKADRAEAYSGGMKRRLNLAAAVVHDPELILLDEPTVGVDPQSRNLILDNIVSLRRDGRTIVYTTHYMEEAERLCDRVAILDRGRLLAEDTVMNLIAAHAGAPVLVTEIEGRELRVETPDPVGELSRLAAQGPVGRFYVERPSLEQVFLHLTGRQLRD